MSGKGKCYLCRRYWFECSCSAQGLAAQVDTRRMVETGTGSMRSTSSVVAVGDAPSPHIGTENPMTDKEILSQQRELDAMAQSLKGSDLNSRKRRLSEYLGGFNGAYSWTTCTPAGDLEAIIASMPHSEQVEALDCEEIAILHGQQVIATFKDSGKAFDFFNELECRTLTRNVSDKE